MANVLIVDDRKINRDFLKSVLDYLNHHTREAQHGIEGLESVEKDAPDLIITDILMPVMDGYEFIRQLKKKEKFKSIPVIIYTATYRKEEALLLAQDLDVKYVLSKPSSPQEIIALIQEAIGLSENSLIPSLGASESKLSSISLYAAPQALFKTQEKLQQAITQVSKIKRMLTLGDKQEFLNEKETLTHALDNIKQDLQGFQKTNKQLFSLIELTLELIGERDIKKLLQLFCHGARKAVDAEFAIAGLIDYEKNLIYLVSSGALTQKIQFTEKAPITSEFISSILRNSSAFICTDVSSIQVTPWKIPHSKNAICCPIGTQGQVHGFSYYINKLGSENFDEEDVRILDTLSSELSIFYENIINYDLIQRQSAKLQIESAKLKEAKENLSKSELMFRQFAENIKDVFWRTSSTLDKIIYISPGYETIWGKPTETIYKDPCSWQDEILDEDKAKVRAFTKHILESRDEGGPIEYRIRRKDGAIRNIYNKTICLKDQKGQLNHLIGIASDITDYLLNQKGILVEAELGRILEKDSSFIETAPKILKLLCNIFDWEIGELWIVNVNNNCVKHVDLFCKKKKFFEKFEETSRDLTFSQQEDLPGLVWKTATSQWLSDYPSKTNHDRATFLSQHDLNDVIGFPLLYQDTVLGVMSFIAGCISPINENFNQILSTIGTRIGDFINKKTTKEQLLQLVKRGGYRAIF